MPFTAPPLPELKAGTQKAKRCIDNHGKQICLWFVMAPEQVPPAVPKPPGGFCLGLCRHRIFRDAGMPGTK